VPSSRLTDVGLGIEGLSFQTVFGSCHPWIAGVTISCDECLDDRRSTRLGRGRQDTMKAVLVSHPMQLKTEL